MKKIKLILALAGATLLSASALAVDNNPPMVNGIPGESIQEGGKFATIKLDNYVSDDMDKPAQIKWSVSGNKNLKVSIKDRVATIETPHPYWNGEENITFAATDSKGAIGSETVTFTVKHVFDENGFCRCDDYQPAEKNDDGYYKIANAGNLCWFANFVNQGNFTANAVLTNNIVVNTLEFADGEIVTDGKDYRVWSPIGYGSSYYQGTFNGNGHTISGLYFNKSNQYNVGLFGQITGNAVIKNVGVIDSYFKGDVGVGGVCGDNDNQKGLIENCYNASIVIGNGYVGGVCGENSGTITNCYNAGGIKGHYSYSYTGGVCGFSEKTIINCYNIGDIEGYYDTGGVCGSNESLIKNCYNTGEVNGDEKTGGVCGYNYYGTIQYCHNVGMVNSEHYYIGGVCGYNSYGTIQHCYFNSDIYQGDASYGDETDETVAGKSSADFKNLVIGLLNVNGNNVWGQGLSYPMLISNHVHEYSNGFCMVCNVCQQPEQDADGVYQIANAGNLYWFMEYVNNNAVYDENADAYLTKANAVLVDDITVNKNLLLSLEKDEDGNVTNGNTFKAWNTIGCFNSGYNEFAYYAGIFDGQGHAISGLYLNNQSLDCVGLFGAINGATIKNVGVVDSYFEGSYYAGGVCGLNSKGHIINCYNTGDVKDSGGFAGGVCGTNDKGAIENCYSTGDVKGEGDTGGVCGYSEDGSTITNCYFLSGTDANATQATAEQFASGEVAYKLGGAFFQTIGEDALPVLDNTHGKVYQTSPCGIAYSNTENAVLEHNFDENGFCTACGAYEPATDSDADGYYEIANAGNLYWFADFVNDMANAEEGNRIYYSSANAVLTADITVNENLLSRLVKDNDGNVTNGDDFKAWNPIGFYYNYGWNVYYAGTFDGNGHTISGLYFNNSSRDDAGLIGLTTEGAVIKNVGVIDSYFSGNYDVGGVCGYISGTIANCYNISDVNGKVNIGGVCGYNSHGPIANCYNAGEVSGGNSVGGVCGENYSGPITNCYNTGEVNGSGDNAGGVCGYNSHGPITNCYNTGEVSGGNSVGGMCGYVGNYCTITNCYNMGAVTCGGSFVGGISGNNDGTIENCYNTGEVNGGDNAGGVCGKNGWGTITNCYYLETSANTGIGKGDGEAIAQTAEQFADGTVAQALRNYDNDKEDAEKIGSEIWGQGLYDTTPNFSGEIVAPIAINETTFPDENFRQYVLDSIDTNDDGMLNSLEFVANKQIVCSSKGIASLQGIEYFTGMTDLDCSDNKLTSVDLSLNTALQSFNCYYNQLTSLDVSANTELTKLICDYNSLTSLDLSKNTNLEHLDCSANKIESLDLSNNINLSYFNGYGNKLKSFDLSKNTKLNQMYCDFNQLTSLTVSPEVEYSSYSCEGNKYEVLEFDAEGGIVMPNVVFGKVSNCSSNVVATKDEATGGTRFTVVDNTVEEFTYTYNIGNTSIPSAYYPIFTIVCPVDDASYVAIDETNFPDSNFRQEISSSNDLNGDGKLSPYEIRNAYSFILKNKNISSIQGIELFTDLFYLDCSGNNLTSVDLSNNTNLHSILMDNNQLDSIDVSHNTDLEDLSMEGNQLTSIDLSQNLNLHILNLSNNHLTDLDLSNNKLLLGVSVKCEGNTFDMGVIPMDGFVMPNVDVLNVWATAGANPDEDVATGGTLFTPWMENSTSVSYQYYTGNEAVNSVIFTISFVIGKKLELSVNDEDFGAVAGAGIFAMDSTVEISATPNAGYHFVNWSNGSTKINDSIHVVSDTALVATFEAHSFGNWDTTLVATCTVGGLRTHTCACGEVETDTIAKLAHTVVVDSAKTATCTATGLTEGKHCSVCDSVLVAQQTVAKLAHTIVVDSAKTATCTVAGLTEGKHCSVCDSILVAQQTLPALGHKIETIAGVSSTCTAEGLTEGSRCSVCGEVIVAQQTIPALGHSFTNYIYNNDATYEADGTEKAECDREGCNAIDVRTAEGTKLQTSVGTELAEGVVIYAHHSTIVVENATEDIFIYNADGRMIARETVTANRMEMPMTEQGVYIVRTGGKVQRVFVAHN